MKIKVSTIRRIIREEYNILRKNTLNEDNKSTLVDYFNKVWSKDMNVEKKIRINKYFKDTYGKYLKYDKNDWEQMSIKKLINLWDEWKKDSGE